MGALRFSIAGTIFAVLALRAAHAGESNPGFDRAEWKLTTSLGASELSPGKEISRTCHGLPKHVVIEVSDPGVMGTAISVLARKERATAETLCATEVAAVPLAGSDGYFWGAVEAWAFVRSPDSFGNLEEFAIFDLESGTKVFAGEGNLERFKVSRKANALSVAYRHRLQVDCPLALEGEACWKKVLEKNVVPSSAKSKMPDCAASFRAEGSPLNNTALVTVPVRIDDLKKPAVTFVGGPADCHPAP